MVNLVSQGDGVKCCLSITYGSARLLARQHRLVMVENHGGAFIGSFECHAYAPDPRAPRTVSVVRITGRTIIGSVEID